MSNTTMSTRDCYRAAEDSRLLAQRDCSSFQVWPGNCQRLLAGNGGPDSADVHIAPQYGNEMTNSRLAIYGFSNEPRQRNTNSGSCVRQSLLELQPAEAFVCVLH